MEPPKHCKDKTFPPTAAHGTPAGRGRPGQNSGSRRRVSLSASNEERAGVTCRKLQLSERGIDFATVAAPSNHPDSHLDVSVLSFNHPSPDEITE
jgi:hypothetical protein